MIRLPKQRFRCQPMDLDPLRRPFPFASAFFLLRPCFPPFPSPSLLPAHALRLLSSLSSPFPHPLTPPEVASHTDVRLISARFCFYFWCWFLKLRWQNIPAVSTARLTTYFYVHTNAVLFANLVASLKPHQVRAGLSRGMLPSCYMRIVLYKAKLLDFELLGRHTEINVGLTQ